MPEILMELMRGPYAGKTLLILRVIFFVFLAVTSVLLLLPGKDSVSGSKIKGRYTFLSVLITITFAALFAYQLKWQLFGAANTELMRFMRRHNSRASVEIKRGSILDRNGSILARDPDKDIADDPALSGQPGKRFYPLSYSLSHTVGYFDPRYGISGIEKYADSKLTGVAGSAIDELARRGRSIIESEKVEGGDVKLTIDARLQRAAAKAMDGKRGAVVVLNPASGEILTLLSTPGFDPHEPGGYYGDDKTAPFLNRAVQGRYPPGSTFKIVMSLIAEATGTTPVLDCPGNGFIPVKRARPIRDSEYYSYERNGKVWPGRGNIGLNDALIHSSNVYFARLGQMIPAAAFNNYIDKLHVNKQIAIFSAGDGEMRIAPRKIPVVKDSDLGARSQLAIGQGAMLVSPMDVAMWCAVAANGGVLVPPHLEHNTTKYAGEQIVPKTAADKVLAMMRGVVRTGTGRAIDLPGLGVAGKTGTAQNPGGEDHAWFTCVTTATTPRLVVTVLAENSGFGSKSALPAAKAILESAEALGIISKEQ